MKLSLFIFVCACFLACQKSSDSPKPGITQFSFSGSNRPPVGTYRNNRSLDSSNKVEIAVNVSNTGNWSATTDTVNGIWFAGTGTFYTTGNQTIVLQGSGIPSRTGRYSFEIIFGNSTYDFTLDVDSFVNIPPTANAGPDVTAYFPENFVTLKGSGHDSDGTQLSYTWTRIEGLGFPYIETPYQAETKVTSLEQGTYFFELKVTDSLGAEARDTVAVYVQSTAPAGSLASEWGLYGSAIDLHNVFFDDKGKITKIGNAKAERRITYLNNLIDTIVYWFDRGVGLEKIFTDKYLYDAKGNVIQVIETDHTIPSQYLFEEFFYNADNSLQRRIVHSEAGGLLDKAYVYTNGNLTGIVTNPTAPNGGDTLHVTYDNRTNNFNSIYPQFYYLDLATEFAFKDQSEIMYFSKNYPITVGPGTVSVSVTGTNDMPYEVKFNDMLWYKYAYH